MARPKGSKSKVPGSSATPVIGFAVNTVESMRNDLQLRDERRSARQAVAQDSTVSSPACLKRNSDSADISSPEMSNKKSKTSMQVDALHTISDDQATDQETTLPKKNKGGRPPKNPKAKLQIGPTRLSSNRPVQHPPTADIWCLILQFSDPNLLINLSDSQGEWAQDMTPRPHSSIFQEVLTNSSIWKEARLNKYGDDHPDPPPGLNEYHYAKLFRKVGCQSKGCQNKHARTIYWAFLQRWCGKCLIGNTVEESATDSFVASHPLFRKCVARATFDSWTRYAYAGDSSLEEAPAWANIHHNTHVRYSRSSIAELIKDTEALAPLTPEERVKWWQDRVEKADKVLESILKIEGYYVNEKFLKSEESRCTREEREQFFAEKALALDRPLSQRALDMMPKYHAAIAIAGQPQERSWKEFLPKLENDREEAETFLRLEAECVLNPAVAATKVQDYIATKQGRENRNHPIRLKVAAAAARVVAEFKEPIKEGRIADSDILPMMLRRTFEEYDPDDVMQYSEETPLLMADAVRVVGEIITPFLLALDKMEALKMLKCPGCNRNDTKKLWEFDMLMLHVYEKHAPMVGGFRYFRVPKAYLPERTLFPWCCINWPKNLPMIAKHHKATGEWNPADIYEYQQEPRVIPRVFSHCAFDGRSVSHNHGFYAVQFWQNIIYVCQALKNSTLDPKFTTQIALKFALRKHDLMYPDRSVGSHALVKLRIALVKEGLHNVFENFSCLECFEDEDRLRRNNKFAERPQTLKKLHDHFSGFHKDTHWAVNMFKLPHEGELWEALEEPANKEALDVFNRLFPIES